MISETKADNMAHAIAQELGLDVYQITGEGFGALDWREICEALDVVATHAKWDGEDEHEAMEHEMRELLSTQLGAM
jgi:hypothetical protein